MSDNKTGFDNIDWRASEDRPIIRRPFSVKVEEDTARAFIAAVKKNGLFVREVMVKLMREYTRVYGEGVENVQ
jgi:hypothetical protein